MKKRTARFWHDQLEAEAKGGEHQIGGTKWRENARAIVKRYRDEREANSGKRFNIFWSNVETLKGTIYSQTPNPDVRRRFRDTDPVGKSTAEILERSLSFILDDYDADEVFEASRDDGLIAGRGQVWVEYDPTLAPMDEGEQDSEDEEDIEPQVEKVDERVSACHVQWADYRHTPVPEWRDVWWNARLHRMDRDELELNFEESLGKQKVAKLPLNIKDGDAAGMAGVWEIWDRKTRKVYWVHETWRDDILKEVEDPLNLENFFPCPEPYVPIRTTDDWTPVPEYQLYQDQAKEIDDLSHRIQLLIKAFRARGAYDASMEGMADILEGEELALVPIKDAERFMDHGGLEKGVMWMPLDKLAAAIQALYAAREQSKQELYEVTGISDIVRGATKASETATAQQLKGSFGNVRMQPRVKPFARFVRDILRIQAEIVAEHYSAETLARMTGIELPQAQEKAALQMRMQQQQMVQQMQAPDGLPAEQQQMPPETQGVMQ